ncbi:hypothetical protein P409_07385 [Inquilinus limosus MP06]|uniref:Uncharacterized protein n=1 Tax=Inquilinus limosus MP06 TaxID=1398085 RepID=A0A0A0DD92_9PROT|nr:hypothetical protein P409_07385 [Inquilinus limosus MP06]
MPPSPPSRTLPAPEPPPPPAKPTESSPEPPWKVTFSILERESMPRRSEPAPPTTVSSPSQNVMTLSLAFSGSTSTRSAPLCP